MLSGRTAGLPYSLSRWTDLPAAKWPWFLETFQRGSMLAFDPHSTVPKSWSLAPQDTHSLVFWTKDPTNLIKSRHLFWGYDTWVQMTLTGWQEVEWGAPKLEEGIRLLTETAKAFGPDRTVWRFSPIPLLDHAEVVRRFEVLALYASFAGLQSVYLSFLQPNDRVPETRTAYERMGLLSDLARVAEDLRIDILMCAEDNPNLGDLQFPCPPNLHLGHGKTPFEGCGCHPMVDPFTVNEQCKFGCTYCYAADRSLSPYKRNTTK